MMKKKLTSLLALLLALMLPLLSLAAPVVATENPLTFNTTTLSGQSIDNSIIGKYDLIMINFWAEWCGPCVNELPDLQKIYKNYKNVLVLGAYVDDNNTDAIATAEAAGITYPLFNAPVSFIFDYLQMNDNRYSIPQTCFFNNQGYQLGSSYVGSRSYEGWAAIVEELLAYTAPSDAEPTAEPTSTPTPEPTNTPAPDPTSTPAASLQKPTIKTQPKSVKAKVGAKVTFKVKAKGKKLSYQWYYRTSSTAKWKKVSSNGKSATLTFKAKAKQHGYQYRCLVKNSAGKVYSKTVKLKIKK